MTNHQPIVLGLNLRYEPKKSPRDMFVFFKNKAATLILVFWLPSSSLTWWAGPHTLMACIQTSVWNVRGNESLCLL